MLLSKIKIILLCGAAAASAAFSSAALEPLDENRARISHLSGTLLLPDYSHLNIDMSFDCGSKWNNTAMIITSEAGAKLLAASYTHLWGQSAGELVMKRWQNKVDADDPRLPTFLVVTPASGADFNWKKSVSLGRYSQYSASTHSSSNVQAKMPTLFATCGTRSH